VSPPEGGGDSTPEAASRTIHASPDNQNRHHQHNGLAAWKRRHAAAQRVAPLSCGCPDPWPCRCSEPPLSKRMIDAGRDAALHILDTGHVPVLKFEVLQALWRRGGADRVLAEQLHQASGGAIR
jgi:hypothetical protein